MCLFTIMFTDHQLMTSDFRRMVMAGLCKFRENLENNGEIIGRHSLVDLSLLVLISIQHVTHGN